MHQPLHKWLRLAILNLNIIALIGIILRYKIAFSLPIVDQKHLLHGHSHFAFSGWVSQVLMTLLVAFLYQKGKTGAFKKYAGFLLANVITAYGMLISFPLQGYGLFSISFSTLNIFVSYFFAIVFWKDLNSLKSNSVSHLWFKAALLFNALSSFGAFSLAIMMANHFIHQSWYLSSVYYFLHFQYNGWFFFACVGLLIDKLELLNIHSKTYKTIFLLFFISCFPAFFLSALWMPIPFWIYILVVAAALAQVIGWVLLLKVMYQHHAHLNKSISLAGKCLLSLAAFALSIKLLLQLGSTYPSLSTLAFGFRPIIIGYLHLVLLGVITLFIIGYMVTKGFVSMKRKSLVGICIFVTGIIFNEILLMEQGLEGFEYEIIPYSGELLLVAAGIMFSGILLFLISQFQHKISENSFL